MNCTDERLSLVPTLEEQGLLARARAGNTEAFEELVKPHWPALLRVTERILRNREDAEDAVQTALLNAWCKLESFHGRARLSSWLTRIAINSALMRLRRNRFKNEVPLDEMTEPSAPSRFNDVEARFSPENAFSTNEVLGLVESGLRCLEPHYVEVLDMSIVQELTGKEAARILDLPVTTIKARLYRARKLLSKRLRRKLEPRRKLANAASSEYGMLQGRAATIA